MRLFLSLLIIVSACSPAWHLQRIKHHMNKAEEKGASIKTDTTYKTIVFDVKGAKTSFDLGPTIIHRKDGVVGRYILKDTVIYKDRIKTEIRDNTVFVECPDEQVEEKVPVAVNTEIKAGYTKWQYGTAIVGGILFGLVLGFILGKVLKVGI